MQDIIAIALSLAAAIYIGRTVLLACGLSQRSKQSGCGVCSTCPSNAHPAEATVISPEMLVAPRRIPSEATS